MATIASFSDVRPRARWAALPGWLLPALIAGWLAADMVLLWRFLGIGGAWIWPVGVLGVVAIGGGIARAARGLVGPRPATLAICLGIAFILLLLGGEGRFFYANLDWQVRDAVLRDMTIHPWPFAYAGPGGPLLLRAPIGLYLVPALAAKLWGQAGGDIGLLVQDTLLLGAMLAMAASLFETARARAIAAVVFLAFSGMDVIGTIMARGVAALHATAHLEAYVGLQYSSTVTLAFWVPQHALAGWLGALAFLLWREGRLRIGGVLALVPLAALWSPLGAIGAVPFALWAGLVDLRRGRVRWGDVALAAGTALFALPALLYLGAAPEAVGAHVASLGLAQYGLFELVDAVPVLLIAWTVAGGRLGAGPLAIATASLFVLPWIEVGWSNDFEMRASIAPLALLAALAADLVAAERAEARLQGRLRPMLIGLLAIGAVTPATELLRALELPTSPVPLCGFSKAWDQTFDGFPKGSYLAPLAKVPALARPDAPAIAADADPANCYATPWPERPMP